MNCQDFNNIIDELADYKPMPEVLREASVSHAALCADCAAKLADARAVSSYLLQAARAESEEAPARVKQNLMAAFSENVQRPKSNVQSQNQDKVAHIGHSTLDFRRRADIGHWTLDIGLKRWFAAAAAIAAVLLLVAIIPIVRRLMTPVSEPDKVAAVSNEKPQPSSVANNNSGGIKPSVEDQTPPEQVSGLSKPPTNKTRSPKRRESVRGSNDESVARNTGEYLPLTYFAEGTAIESGTVVRVELSRAALASLGFNTSVNNSDETVKADVVLGDDGVARAIRLVE